MISYASMSDIPALIGLIKSARKASSLGDFAPDDEVIRKTIASCIVAPHIFLRVLHINGCIRGLICGVITPSLDLYGDTATDIFYYVDPEVRGNGLKLLRAFMKWAFSFDSVQYLALNISIGGEEAERTERLYTALGGQKTGASFVFRRNQ